VTCLLGKPTTATRESGAHRRCLLGSSAMRRRKCRLRQRQGNNHRELCWGSWDRSWLLAQRSGQGSNNRQLLSLHSRCMRAMSSSCVAPASISLACGVALRMGTEWWVSPSAWHSDETDATGCCAWSGAANQPGGGTSCGEEGSGQQRLV
jgi:hypothetical protein